MVPSIPEPPTADVRAFDGPLPKDLREALRAEWARVLHPPFETPLTAAVDPGLMSSAWFFLPPKAVDEVFTLHGSVAFAFVLSGWMYSDVPATNVLAPDGLRIRAAMDQPRVLRRLLLAKGTVLRCFVAPVCLLISLIIHTSLEGPPLSGWSSIASGALERSV